ncbi:MAG TPA: helicase-related protein [Vicinamibacterales bacterium]|nr:helicase-related protein [Vicinamibacterales bacterium]
MARGHRCRLETTVRHTDCDELHLTREADGTRRILLWPFDRPAVCADQRRPRAVRLRVWAASVLRDAARTIDPLTPRSRRSSADLIAFQLAPAVAAAGGVCRLLLADEVGLGKTIQAGWIVSDVLARDPDARILLAVPAGVRHQWASELAGRFNLQLSVVDARWLRNTVADIPGDSSPWTAPGIYVGSIDFLKRPDVAEGIASHVWDLLVVDEAHTAAAPTDRHTALQRFAARSRRVVAITATPYSGTPGSFASLASIGATPAAAPPLMFRRSRADVGDARRRRHRFARVRTSGVEGRFQRLLERYSRDVWNEPLADRDAARLAVTILRKRALSSPAAAAQSLRRRLALLQGRGRIPRQLALFEDDDPLDDEVAPGSLAAPGLADAAREHRCLAALIAAADAAAGTDSKLRYLRRLVGRVPRESLVVFTEYRDTLLQIAAALPPSLQLHGGLASPDRAAVQRRFNAEGGLLLATDAAAEGLNLHEHCRMVVNYELPWNPARLEQRIGRVDRIGQRRTVHALTLTARDTAEDLVIGNLARRLSRIVAALGADDRLGAFLDDARTAGIVIGGDAVEALPDGRENDTVAILRHDGDPGRSGEAARQIAAHRRIAGTRDDSGRNVLVSSMRARAGTPPPGYVAALSCTARTIEGFPVAVRQFLLHLEASPCRPCTAGDVRRAAAPVIERLNTSRLPAVDVWFAGVCDAHDAAAAAMAARERELSDRPRDRAAVQPGLFDRRALAEAARIVTTEDRLRQTHLGEIERLERSRPLHLSCGVSAVLILWR